MILGDFGTSYCKILDLDHHDREPRVIASRKTQKDIRVTVGTGHNGRRFTDHYVNELIALARGGEAMIEEQDYVLLDCGSRDIKFVHFKNGRLADMGWNSECGASMGFTIELLSRYYNLDYNRLKSPEKPFSVTCGVLGMSNIFDAVVSGSSESEAVARFVMGIALNAHRFAGSPETIYLSGGLCDNQLFVKSFPGRVVPLGRFVLLKGLQVVAEHLQAKGLLNNR